MSIKKISFVNSNEFIDSIASVGLKNHASDVHITPGKHTVIVKYRIGGELRPIYQFSMELYSKFLNSVKVRSGMDISEQNHIQDGKIFIDLEVHGKMTGVNLRVSSLPVVYGENIVMRMLLSKSEYLDINSLGFSEKNTLNLKKIKDLNEGLVLVSGGTGSGKTTTIYSLLNMFDKEKTGIFTLEDPIEYQVDGYIQSQIKNIKGSGDPSKSFTFEEGLIGILRQDPDIIMIGELRRDQEAETCFDAANTGHLVFGTIHANNAISVITRIRQFGIESYLIASGLEYIISQEINKTLCSHCKIKKTMKKTEFSHKIQRFIKNDTIDVYEADHRGCSKCKNGFGGIGLLGEVIKIDDKLYDLLLNNAGETELKKYLYESGFIPYYIDALNKSVKGIIDINDVIDLEY